MLIFLPLVCQLGAVGPWEVARKPIHPTTDLVRQGQSCVQVVVPRAAEYFSIGAQVAEALGIACGQPVPVVEGEELIDPATHLLRSDRRRSHFILLGAFFNNPLLARLYYTFYDPTDAYFPGPGGYELRTVGAPFEYGFNCIVLGGSDREGVQRAAKAFIDRLVGPEVPFLREIVPGGAAVRRVERWRAQYSDQWIADLDRYLDRSHPDFQMWFPWWDRSSETAWYQGCLAVAGTTLMRYDVSGLPGAGRAAQRLVRAILDQADVLDRLENNYFEYCLPQLLLGWDRAEEAPLFTDQERQAMAQLLAHIGQLSDESFWNYRDPGQPVDQVSFQGRHQLDGTKAMFDLATYLQRNCEISAEFRQMTEKWQQGARALFAKHATAPLVADAYFGFYEAQLVAEWALASGDHTYFDNGGLRTAAQLSTATIDNLLGGYAFGWGSEGVTVMAAPPLLGLMAEWVYDEPSPARSLPAWQEAEGDVAGDRWTFWNDSDLGVFSFRFPWRYPPAIPGGITVIPLSEAIYRDVRNKRMDLFQGMADTSAPLERCFHKLSLRRGLDPASEYLLLDGQGGVVYSMVDTNSILKLTDRGQRLLVAHYGQPGALGQNVIAVSTGLLPEPMEYAASLERAMELETFGAISSRAARWNGLDWTRHILWLKGRGFIVLDELTPLDGERDVFLTATWNTVAPPIIVGQTAEVPLPAGVFRIATARPVSVRAEDKTVRQRQTAHLTPGQPATFASWLYASTPESPQDYEVREVSPTALLLRGETPTTWLALVGVGHTILTTPEGVLAVNAEAFSIAAASPVAPSWLSLAGFRSLRLEDEEILSGDGSSSFEWCPETGDFRFPRATSAPRPLPSAHRQLPSGLLARLLAAAWNAAAVPAAPQPAASPEPPLAAEWEWTPAQPASAGPLRAGDLNGDGVAEIVARIGPGRIVALSSEGKPLWQHERLEGLADVFAADLEGKGTADVLVVENPRRVVRLRGDGTVVWVWEGVPNNVNLVYADDLNGDGGLEIIVGYFNGYLALTAAGELLWRKSGYGHNATLCRVRDLDGDGVPELLGGSMAATFCIFDEARAQGVPKAAFTNVRIAGLEFADADGDAREEVLLATDQGLACYSPAADQYLWTRRSDTPLVGLSLFQTDLGPHLFTATQGAFAQIFSLQGQLEANQLVGDAINALCPCGQGYFALACDDGWVRLVDTHLQPTARAVVPGRPTALLEAGGHLIVGSDSGQIQAFKVP